MRQFGNYYSAEPELFERWRKEYDDLYALVRNDERFHQAAVTSSGDGSGLLSLPDFDGSLFYWAPFDEGQHSRQ